MVKLVLAAVIAGLPIFPAGAQQAAVRGVGAGTCAKFAQIYKANPGQTELIFFSWAHGFMSGYNMNQLNANKPTRDLNATELSAQQTVILQYCDEHPLQAFAGAALFLYLSLPLSGSNN